jgi:hypothetical protein
MLKVPNKHKYSKPLLKFVHNNSGMIMPKQCIYNNKVNLTVGVVPISYQPSTYIMMFSTLRILAVIFFFVLQLNAHMHLVGVQIRNRSLLFPPRLTGNIYAIFPQMQETALVKVFSKCGHNWIAYGRNKIIWMQTEARNTNINSSFLFFILNKKDFVFTVFFTTIRSF